jgi:hypothetical protein
MTTTDPPPTARCPKCAAGEPHLYTRGLGGYSHHRCRCNICVGTWNGHQRNHYRRNPEKRIAQVRAYQRRRTACLR